MFLRRKLRFGGALMIIGGLAAALGEVINIQNMDVLSPSWHLSLECIVIGMLVLLIGLSTFASVSDQVSGLGFVGSILLTLGGLLLIIGTIALDWIILPFLINLANTIAATINQPATTTQNELNNVIATLNGLEGSTLQKLFPGSVPHISIVHIPLANGKDLVNSVLVQLNVPKIEMLQWWGRFSLAGGPLTPGCLLLGVALSARDGRPTPAAALLIIGALLNVLCLFVATIPALYGNITAAALFLTLAWIGLSAWSTRRGDGARFVDEDEAIYVEP